MDRLFINMDFLTTPVMAGLTSLFYSIFFNKKDELSIYKSSNIE